MESEDYEFGVKVAKNLKKGYIFNSESKQVVVERAFFDFSEIQKISKSYPNKILVSFIFGDYGNIFAIENIEDFYSGLLTILSPIELQQYLCYPDIMNQEGEIVFVDNSVFNRETTFLVQDFYPIKLNVVSDGQNLDFLEGEN